MAEGFTIGESIRSSLPFGANDELRFGRFESALDRFKQIVEHAPDEGLQEQCHA